MKKHYLLLSPFLLFTTLVPADERDELANQQEQLQREIEHIRQTTRDERARIEALETLIERQREQNRQLDRQLQGDVPSQSEQDKPDN